MDNSQLLDSIHKRMLHELLQKSSNKGSPQMLKEIIAIDQNLRKEVADLYVRLVELGDKELAINLLSDHVAIMVEMIIQFKNE